MAVSPTQLSVIRMIPIAGRIARAGRGRLAVFRLLNSTRGWDASHTPVDDVRWALEQVRERYGPDLPICLVGHSLGGRAALLSGDQEGVRSIVALAPWVYDSDGAGLDLTGRAVLIVHGDQARSAHVAQVLRRTAEVGYVRVSGGKHAMLRHGGVFDSAATDFATATLLDTKPRPPVSLVLAGQALVEV